MGLLRKEILRDNRILQFIIATIAAVLCLMVWPFRVFYHEAVSEGKTETLYETDRVTMEEIVLQQFFPGGDHLQELAVKCSVSDVHALDRVFVTVYDQDFAIVYQEVPYFNEIEGIGEIRISPDLDVTPGGVYYVGLNVHFDSVGTLRAAYAEAQELQIRECGALSYASEPLEGMQLKMRFVYTKPYSAVRILCCIAAILAGGAALYAVLAAAIAVLKKKQCWEGVRRVLAAVFFAAVAAGALASAWFLCIARTFGGKAADLTVYACAVLSILLTAGYACCRSLSGWKTRAGAGTGDGAVIRWRDYLQMICFALLIWAGVRYTDADIQWKQDLAGCWVYLLFGAALLFSLPKRSVFHPLTLLWGLFMIPASMLYCRRAGVDVHEVQIARCLMAAVFVWGIVFLHVIRNGREQARQKVCLPAAVCFCLLCLLLVLHRYTKTWPVFMTVTFLLFYLICYPEKEKQRLMHQFMNGVIFHFIWMWVMCLCFRPYHYYRFHRYPMYFHTVASTGMYLVMVEAVVLVRLFMRMKKSGSVWRGAWKEWLLQAVVLGYTALSAARTAFAAIAGLMVMLMIAAAVVFRPRLRVYLASAGAGVGSLLLMFPVVYTLTRCVPAVVGHPVRVTEQELFSEAVVEGEKPDSPRYMNVEALFELWFNRLAAPEMSEDRLSSSAAPEMFRDRFAPSDGGAETVCAGLGQNRLPEAGGMPLVVLGMNASAGGISLSANPAETFGGHGVFPALGLADAGAGAASAGAEQDGSGSLLDHVSNGRFGIYRAYISRLNLNGHEQMGIDEDGIEAMHAHNSFIQIAYDFGIPAGLLYLGLMFGMLGRSVYLIWRGRDRSEMQFMTLSMLAAFVLVSLFEYTANPCLPLGFASLFVLFTMRREKSILSLNGGPEKQGV